MRKSFTSLKRNIASSLILHTVIVFLLATIGATLSGKLSLIISAVVAAAAITIYTIRNICRCVAEDYSERAKEFESVSSSLEETSSILRAQKKELERCVVNLSRYSETMGKLAAEINAANQDPAEKIILQINDVESPIPYNCVVTRGGGHDET